MTDKTLDNVATSKDADNSQMKQRLERQSQVSPDAYPKSARADASLVRKDAADTDKAHDVDG